MNIIAVLAEGAMRDALSILERCIQDGENKIDEDKIKDLVGIPKITYVHNIIDSLFKYDVDNTLKNVDIVLNEGKDINNLLWEMIKYTKDLLVYKASQKLDLYSEEEIANIEEISKNISKQDLINMVYELSELENDIKWSTQKTIIFQAGMIKLCNKEKTENKGLEERVEKIEKYLKSGKIGMHNKQEQQVHQIISAQEQQWQEVHRLLKLEEQILIQLKKWKLEIIQVMLNNIGQRF